MRFKFNMICSLPPARWTLLAKLVYGSNRLDLWWNLTCMYIHIYVYVCVYICVRFCFLMHSCIELYYEYTYIYICIYIYGYTLKILHIRHMYVLLYIYIYISHICKHFYIHTYVCNWLNPSLWPALRNLPAPGL